MVVGGGGQEHNMCIRPHNIIYNRQTHFHTNGFHHRGSPLALKEREAARQREGRARLYSYSKSDEQLESASRTTMTAFCSVEISQPRLLLCRASVSDSEW